RAEAFDKFHKKGASAFFEGRLELDTWDDKATGQKRSKLYVVADNWEFVGQGSSGSAGGGRSSSGGGYESEPSQQAGYGDYGGGAGDFLGVDDTPF
ncbi:MAG TPA: single-stranded DNA-binding protein, partial [Planctomycetota bacterium]|nr:single-stranded DNA-binding protein [Planctomycetota bacterium]